MPILKNPPETSIYTRLARTPIGALSWILLGAMVALPSGAEKVWVERNRLVVIEAESVESLSGKDWSRKDEKPGFSGSGYLVAEGANNNGKGEQGFSENMVRSSKTLHYRVKIENPGFYLVKIHNWHHGEDSGNDVWVSLNRRRFKKQWDHQVQKWSWDEGYTRFYGEWLSADSIPKDGIVDLYISCRSRLFHMDRILLVGDGVEPPLWSDLGQRESPLLSALGSGSAPGTPGAPRIDSLTATSVVLSWDGAGQNTWRTEVLLDGSAWGGSSANSWTTRRLQPGRRYQARLRSVSPGGLESAASQTVSFTTPSFVDGRDGVVLPKTAEPPEIDGRIVEKVWEAAVPKRIGNLILGAVSGEDDLSGSFRGLWSEAGLHFAVEVKDDKLRKETDAGSKWDLARDDGIDLHLDLGNLGLSHNGPLDLNYRLRFDDSKVYEVANWYEADQRTQGAKVASRQTEGGYAMEVFLPWQTLGHRPETGSVFGVDVSLNDNDGNEREAKLSWYENRKDDIATWSYSPARLGKALLFDGHAVGLRLRPVHEGDVTRSLYFLPGAGNSYRIDGRQISPIAGQPSGL